MVFGCGLVVVMSVVFKSGLSLELSMLSRDGDSSKLSGFYTAPSCLQRTI